MKKLIFALATAALAFSFSAGAQHYDNTRMGVVAGLTSTSTNIKNVDTKSVSQYHAGVAFEFPLGGGFAIQPEVIYQVKGMSLDKVGDATIGEIGKAFETKVGYVELPVQIQWGPDLMVFRPYGFVEPFVGYRLTQKSEGAAKALSDELQTVEYGMSLGFGIELSRLQISAKYFWNFGNVYKSDLANTANTITALKDGNNFNGIAVSLGLFF